MARATARSRAEGGGRRDGWSDRRQRRRGGSKPRDIGTGVVCASLGRSGSWLSVGAAWPGLGFLELTGMPPFDERQRGDAAAVRRWRGLMTGEASAFLLVEPLGGTRARHVLPGPIHETGSLSQRWYLRLPARAPAPPAVRLRYRGRLAPPALAMVTEVGRPAPPRELATKLSLDGLRLAVRAPGVGAEVVIDVRTDGLAGEWRAAATGEATLELTWPSAAERASFSVTVSLARSDGGTDAPAGDLARPDRRAATATRSLWPELPVPARFAAPVGKIAEGALRYVRECTALRVAPGRVAILTDHRLLPLSWTRDAYWQALLLLRHGYDTIVANHLRWLWLDCERPDGSWARSHHPDGRRKDEAYQADQQLYPVLELADHHRATGSLPELDSTGGNDTWPVMLSQVLGGLERQMGAFGLLRSDENAADDPAGLPFLLSNQLLAWYTLSRLAEIAELGPLDPSPARLAARIRESLDSAMSAVGQPGRVWPYAIDGQGGTMIGHDANDVPTALAPMWGYCAPDDPGWQATMEFAFSPANEAYASGRFGGLGSRHTPGTWSLGLIQEWAARSLAGRRTEAADALERLVAIAQSDWSLPEASHPDTGRASARHWFAWPAALVGALAARR